MTFPFLVVCVGLLSRQDWGQILISENITGSSGRCLVNRKLTFGFCLLWFLVFPAHVCTDLVSAAMNDDESVRIGPHCHRRCPVLVMSLGSPLGKVRPKLSSDSGTGATVEARAASSSHGQMRKCFHGDYVGSDHCCSSGCRLILKPNSKQKRIPMLN